MLSLAVRYQYDEEDQLIGKTVFSDGQSPVHTAYAYDHLHNLSQITGEDVFQRISYSSHGLLEQTTTGYASGGADHTVKQENYVYGTADTALHQHTVTYGGKTNTDTYTYDGRGNITQIIRKVGSTEYIIKYTYDAANQLIREDNQQAGYSWVMTYDDAGNMLTRKKYSYTTGTLGSVLSTQTLTYGNATWGDLLTGINGTTVTSDVIGNILNDGTWTYTWKNGRQLATMSKSGVTWSFAYDASGMRTQRSNGSTSTTYNYTYNGSQLTHMTYGSNSLHFYYDASGRPLSVVYNGATYYYILSLQGDVVAILNSSGVSVVEYTYDAWGRLLSTTGSMSGTLGLHNPLRYRGYVYDRETGLYYLQSRYYNPSFCRFISADGLIAVNQGILGYNLFAYCNNNPVLSKDSGGEYVESALDVVSIGLDIVDLAANPLNILSWAALAADVASLLLPGITGGGGVVRVIASTDKLQEIAKYSDDIIDAGKAITSSLELGADMHKAYTPVKAAVDTFTNKALKTAFNNVDSLLRPDGINKVSKVIYELKPCNLKSLKAATKQVKNYLNIIGNADEWIVVIDLYF